MGNISKSLARLIWGSTATTAPNAADRFPLSPTPNTPMVTESKHVTYENLIAGAAGLGYALPKVATVDILHAAILTLPTVAVTIVPGVASKILVPSMAIFQTINTVAYTGIDANALIGVGPVIPAGGSNSQSLLCLGSEATNITVGNLINSNGGLTTASVFFIDDHAADPDWNTNCVIADYAAAPIKLFIKNGAGVNFGDGNAANKIRVTVFYNEVAVLT